MLGAAILNADKVPVLIELLSPQHFYSSQNGQVFAQVVRLFNQNKGIDFVTLLNAVVGADVFESSADAKVYITTLAETVPSISNVESYARIVYEKYLIRQLMLASKDIIEHSQDGSDADSLLEYAEQKIYEIRQGRETNTLLPIETAILETYAHLQRISGPDKAKYLGIPTSFSYLDKMLTGLGRSDLIILAARPGMGKTSFALNIATNVARLQNVPVAIFSLEMTREQLAGRILSSEALIDSSVLRTGELTSSDWVDLAAASDKLSKAMIYLDDSSGITIPEIKAKVRRINQNPEKPDIGLIIIDYLQLMSLGRRSETRTQEVSEMTRNLKIMAKELNIPVIVLSQLSRNTERGTGRDHRPALSDLRDSGSIEQDADVVLFLYREAYYNTIDAATNEAECIIAKNRHGDTGTVYLGWDGTHTRFYSVDNVHTDEY